MGPTNLSPSRRDPGVGAEPIAADDLLRLASQQGFGDLARAVAGDGEDRSDPGHGHPEPGFPSVLPPRGLVDVRRTGGVDRDGQFVVRGLQDLGTASLQLGDHPGGDRQPEEVGGQLLDLPLAQPVSSCKHGHHGLQIRPEASTGDTGGQGPAGGLPTAGTGQAMEPVFVDDRLNLGQLGDLMDQGGGIVALKFIPAAATRGRLAIEGLVDLLGRDQGAVSLAMPGLSAPLLPTARHRRLALQADRIGRGWLRRVGRVELEPSLEVVDSGFQRRELLLMDLDQRQDCRLKLRRGAIPEMIRERRGWHYSKVVS